MKTINNYSYTSTTGIEISIRTEKYGVAGFDVYVTIEKMGIKDHRSNLFKNLKGEWLIAIGVINGRNTLIKPQDDILKAMLSDKNTPTEERKQYEAKEADRRRKEREWDDLYNDGADGFNPYRRGERGIIDNTPYFKGDNNPD